MDKILPSDQTTNPEKETTTLLKTDEVPKIKLAKFLRHNPTILSLKKLMLSNIAVTQPSHYLSPLLFYIS